MKGYIPVRLTFHTVELHLPDDDEITKGERTDLPTPSTARTVEANLSPSDTHQKPESQLRDGDESPKSELADEEISSTPRSESEIEISTHYNVSSLFQRLNPVYLHAEVFGLQNILLRMEAAKARKDFLSLGEEFSNHGEDEVVRAQWCCAVLELTQEVEGEDSHSDGRLASDAASVRASWPSIIDALLEAARQYQTSALVQGTVCRMLRFLSHDEQSRLQAVFAGSITAILDAICEHKDEEGVKAEACAALALLVNDTSACHQSGVEIGVERVSRALEQLREDPVALKWALWLLAEMSQDPEAQNQVPFPISPCSPTPCSVLTFVGCPTQSPTHASVRN